MRTLLLLLLSVGLTACEWGEQRKTSTLVIAVEGLDFDSVTCVQGGPELTGGFFELCRDSVRFTHAYTPSTMSQAALSSVLTARYPVEHGVRHNGEQYLTEKIETVQEVAVRRNFRTALFSGGAPIWRKSGISQGFEYFDDNVSVALGRYYRSAAENFSRFRSWLKNEVGNSNFFSVVYLNDLQFVNTPTRNERGLEQSLTRQSQLVAIDVALSQLITFLKRENRWHQTNVFVMGLNGQSFLDRPGEIRGTNLHSENTHVVLMIKPARKKRDEGIEWTIGANVSLVDVGATLFSLVGAGDFSFFERTFEVASLTTSMERPVVNWNKNRLILSESAWPEWRQVSNPRVSLRQSNWLYVQDSNPELYNTLLDVHETNPIKEPDAVALNQIRNMHEFLDSRGVEAWRGISEDLVEKIHLGRDWSRTSDLTKQQVISLRHILSKRPWDTQLVGWMARFFIEKQDWEALEQFSEEYINSAWAYFSARLQDKEAKIPASPCVGIVIKDSEEDDFNSDCGDSLLIGFLRWVESAGSQDENSVAMSFLRSYYYQRIDDEIGSANYMNGLFWDVALDRPGLPSLVELVMRLPKYKRYKALVDQNLKSLSALPASNFY